MYYIQVGTQYNDEVVEIETADDETMYVETLQTHFGRNAVGLNFLNPETDSWRLVGCNSGRLYPPKRGWQKKLSTVSSMLVECSQYHF